jgi:hypothetical protein
MVAVPTSGSDEAATSAFAGISAPTPPNDKDAAEQ